MTIFGREGGARGEDVPVFVSPFEQPFLCCNMFFGVFRWMASLFSLLSFINASWGNSFCTAVSQGSSLGVLVNFVVEGFEPVNLHSQICFSNH